MKKMVVHSEEAEFEDQDFPTEIRRKDSWKKNYVSLDIFQHFPKCI